jgi:glyoxylase-like metal-dependent hydrolase (beta-lactamase superfamily II)
MSVSLTAMTCGWLEGNLGGFLAQETGTIKVPVPSYLIDHPRGRVLFDSGLHPQLQTDPRARLGEYLASAFKPFYAPGEEVGARLRSIGVDPARINYLVTSHLHFDHVGGNSQIPNAQIVVQRREWQAGHDAELIRRNSYNRDDFDLGHDVLQIEGEYDLFGDGRVVCLPSYGHTAGTQSLRIRLDSGREVVLASDACYMRRSLEELRLPSFWHSREASLETLLRFKQMEQAGARLIFGHDPEQWKDAPPAPHQIS